MPNKIERMGVNSTQTYNTLASLPDHVLIYTSAGLSSVSDWPSGIGTSEEYALYKFTLGGYGLQILFASNGYICIRRYENNIWKSWMKTKLT